MMGLGEIRRLNDEATRRAKAKGKRPWHPTPAQREQLRNGASLEQVGCHFPAMGDYCPRGYEPQATAYFVDKSGFGSESEPAMTQRRLAREIGADDLDIAYGTSNEGQFQITVERYLVPRKERVRRDAPAA